MELQVNMTNMQYLEDAVSQLQIGKEDAVQTVPLLASILGPLAQMPLSAFGKKLTSKNYKKEGAIDNIPTKQLIYSGRMICLIASNAINSMLEGEYSDFDALVSECQCELRAAQTAMIALKVMNEKTSLKQALQDSKKALDDMSNKMHTKVQKLKGKDIHTLKTTSIQDGLKTHAQDSWELQVPQEVIPLTLMYMLCKTRVFKQKNKPCGICKAEVSGIFEETNAGILESIQKNALPGLPLRLVNIAKELLTKIGCDFLQKQSEIASLQIAPMLANSCRKIEPSAVVIQKTVDENGNILVQEEVMTYNKTLLPFYYLCKAAFDVVVHNRVPVIFKSKLSEHTVEVLSDQFDTALVLYNGQLCTLTEANDNEKIHNLAAYVIEVQRCKEAVEESQAAYQNRLKAIPISTLVEWDAARHRQYLGKVGSNAGIDDIPQLSENERARLKALYKEAELQGCTHEKPTTAVVTHVFASTIRQQFNNGNIK